MMSSSMWNPYQSNKQSASIYTTPISPLNSSTGSETSASSLNSSEHEKLNSNNRNNLNQNLQQTSLSVSSFIPTPDYDNEEQQQRESSPNAVNNTDYISHHNTQMHHNSNMAHHHHQQQQQSNSFHQTPVLNIQNCGRASTDSESVSNSSDASSSPDSTGSPTYRSPSNSFTGYSSSTTTNVTINQMHQTYSNNNSHFNHQQSFNTQPVYNYFGDFQNSYYSSAGQIPIKQELKKETFLNDYSKLNNFSTNHHQYSMNNTTAFGTNSLEKLSDESSKSSSSPPTTPILPLANMTNNIADVATSPFNMHHPHNPYAVHAAAAVNNYYNSMNLNPYSHYHHHHHPPYLNHNYNTAQFNNSYSSNRDSNFNSTNTFLNSSVTTPTIVSAAPSKPTIKTENNLPTSNINRSTNNNNNNNSNISTISDSNITNSYETSPGLLPYLQVNLKGNLTSNPNIKAKLQDQSLWKQFNQIGTEMIITKCGRRMFPSLRVSVSGLDSNSKYTMLIEIVPVDDNRYKYHNGEWIISGKAEAHFVGRGYLHPDSPLSGNQWMKQIISFHKLKLTNNPFDRSGHIILNSMHKYVPRLHIIEEGKSLTTFVFNEAIFTAVTAYQNEMITKLKIEYNPFAKGFRDGQNRKDYRNKRNSDDENENIDERNFIPSMNNHMKTMKYNDENYDNMKLNYVR